MTTFHFECQVNIFLTLLYPRFPEFSRLGLSPFPLSFSLKLGRSRGCCSVTKSCPISDPLSCSTSGPLSFTVSLSLFRFTSIELVMLPNHLVLSCPLLLLPSIFPRTRIFSKELAVYIRWPKYWSFSISPSNEYSVLISFRIDFFDLLAVQGTLKGLLQHHGSKVSVLWCSAFFMVQLSHQHMTTAGLV